MNEPLGVELANTLSGSFMTPIVTEHPVMR
jgi:hypothetical protein